MIIGIISIHHQLAYVLFDLDSSFSYVFTYFTSQLGLCLDSLSMPLCIATLIGDSLVVNQVYGCVWEFGTKINLIILDKVDFNVILGMD